MAYNETLSFRLHNLLLDLNITFVEKKMFGGITFMINDKMCLAIMKEQLMLRVMDEFYESLLEENDVSPMDFTGKAIKGFVYIEPESLSTEKQLLRWIDYGLDFAERGILKSKKKK